MRGLSAPYGLSYTPGMWLNSIQVSKGTSSVTAGHEAITGQINLEHRKPTDEERLFVNLYLDDELRPEANISTAFPVTKDKKLTSVLLLHGSMDTDVRKMDHNHDGFRDLPKADQINVANKWLYAADDGTQIRWGWKFVQENRLGGMTDYKRSMRERMTQAWDEPGTLYGSHIRNRNANGYVKLGMPVGASVYDADEQDEDEQPRTRRGFFGLGRKKKDSGKDEKDKDEFDVFKHEEEDTFETYTDEYADDPDDDNEDDDEDDDNYKKTRDIINKLGNSFVKLFKSEVPEGADED